MNKVNIDFIRKCIEKYDIKPDNTLDIGSLDINGNPRHLFKIYTGIDMREGENVDEVINANSLEEKGNEDAFDCVLCLNMMEHDKYFHETLHGINHVLQKGGYFFFSVPTVGFPVHDYPYDYWRFTKQAVEVVIMDGFKILEYEEVPTKPNTNYVINCLGKKL